MWTMPARAWRAAAHLRRSAAALMRLTPTLKQVIMLQNAIVVLDRDRSSACSRPMRAWLLSHASAEAV